MVPTPRVSRWVKAREIYQLLDELEPVSEDEEVFRPVHELYSWPLAGALLLSMLLALGASGLLREQLRALAVRRSDHA